MTEPLPARHGIILRQACLLAGNAEYLVSRPQFGVAFGHDVIVPAAYHHHQRIGIEPDIPHPVSVHEPVGPHLLLGKLRLHLIRHVNTETVLLELRGETQHVGHGTHRSTLYQQRHDGDEKDRIEYHPRIFQPGHERVGGEDDGNGSPQPHPRDIKLALDRNLPERCKTQEHAHGTCHEYHKNPHEQPGLHHVEHFVRIHQQTERNEHHNLEEPRITVEEGGQALLEHYLVVADHQSGDIDGQVTVAVHEVGQREDEIHQREQEYRIERFVVQVDMVEHIDGEPAEQVSGHGAYRHLHDESQHRLPHVYVALRYRLHENYRQNVGHRVVTSALQLQQRPQVLLQPLFFGAQDGEHRRRIRGGHHRREQERFGQRKADAENATDEIDEEPRQRSGQEHPDRSKHHPLGHYGTYLGILRIHTAGKEDDAQREHTDELGRIGAVELDAESVAAEKHTDEEEQKQRRRTELRTGLGSEYRND